MTQPHEVNVTDAEVRQFLMRIGKSQTAANMSATKTALAAFLAARMPDARPDGPHEEGCGFAFNNCRAAVLRGPG